MAKIIDPNDAIASDSLINLGLNATPDYSDMIIFAELTAQRRSSSVISTNGVGKSTTLESGNDAVKINMMGFDQDKGEYTTRWTNNSDTTITPYEGFGITKIDMKTTSSYVPQINIEFVDIRGQSLITLGSKSPYSVLYSFPPPLFTLTIKGYFGKALSYDLHLVKQATKFDATTGNYIINAEFIASRYAPLTDVLFKYVDIVPLMESGINLDGEDSASVKFDPNAPPKNTRELITRAKKLYDDINQLKVDSKETAELNEIKNRYTDIQSLLRTILGFKTYITSDIKNNFNLYIAVYPDTYSNEVNEDMVSNEINTFKILTRLSEYDEIIKATTPNENSSVTQKLCILFDYAEEVNGNDNNLEGDKKKVVFDNINSLKLNLLEQAKTITSKIKQSSIKELNENLLSQNKRKYVGLDITQFYIEIRQIAVTLEQEYNTKNKAFKDQIIELTEKTLIYKPTIRNIFGTICNDVEIFFKKLKTTCENGEESHKNNFDQIIANNNSKSKTISPFPLILKNTTLTSENGNAINKTQRAYPGEDGLGFNGNNFPEVDFVENFISTFLKQIKEEKINNLKESIDEDGNNKWIPINALDSVVNGRLRAESPYKGKYTIQEILDQILNRYYIASQYSYGYLFYEPDASIIKDIGNFFGLNIENKNDTLVNFLAEAEATNLVNSIVDLNLLNLIETQMTTWSQNYDLFTNTLESSIPHYSSFSDQIDPVYGDSYLILNNQKVTKNRLNDAYKGFELLFSNPVLRNKSNSGTAEESDGQINIVENFIKKVGDDGFLNNIVFDSHGFDDFTKQNIPYISDDLNSKDIYESDFIRDGSILDNFVSSLGRQDNNIKTVLNDVNLDNNIKTFFIVNYLCNSLTYYDNENDLNKKFALPAVIEVPRFAHLFMGGYVYFYKYNSPEKDVKMLYYNNTYPHNLFQTGDTYAQYIKNLSDSDADLLLTYYTEFVNDITSNGYTYLESNILNLINRVSLLNIVDVEDKKDEYEKRLKPNSDLKIETEGDFSFILKKLMFKEYLLNYTETTFLGTDVSDNLIPLNNFITLKELNLRSDRNTQINEKYFLKFFNSVIKLTKEKKDSLRQIENSFREGIEDNDIKTQTYYSFKAIADKWIMGYDDGNLYGNRKSINGEPISLINEFLFVDRFFNDIGDISVIDFRPLINMSQDFDISVFSVFSNLLSSNGFEFFPIQNFLNFNNDEWEASFKTYGSSRELIKSKNPAFICMYVGGSSSQLDDSLSGYESDGIDDASKLEGIADYNPDEVRGFRINFGKQNQTMFTGIELNQNEFKESNESLSILSEIAQDQSASSPVPKGQNLFSTYEQRAYTCKIQGMGNAMIQPTQYFILENVPMFNGAYLILTVEHSIIPNSMKTSFEGLRIRSNPNPLVTDFSTATGLNAGESNLIGNGIVNQANVSVNKTSSTYNGSESDSSSPFPINPAITRDMTQRLISPTN